MCRGNNLSKSSFYYQTFLLHDYNLFHHFLNETHIILTQIVPPLRPISWFRSRHRNELGFEHLDWRHFPSHDGRFHTSLDFCVVCKHLLDRLDSGVEDLSRDGGIKFGGCRRFTKRRVWS